jgi:hypothetical protein
MELDILYYQTTKPLDKKAGRIIVPRGSSVSNALDRSDHPRRDLLVWIILIKSRRITRKSSNSRHSRQKFPPQPSSVIHLLSTIEYRFTTLYSLLPQPDTIRSENFKKKRPNYSCFLPNFRLSTSRKSRAGFIRTSFELRRNPYFTREKYSNLI